MIKNIHCMPIRSAVDGSSLSNTQYIHKIFDKTFVYDRNSEGYRSDEFQKNPKFLFAGCSETFGESGDYETTWAYKLFNKVKGTDDAYCNIGVPGIDISLVIYHIMMFIEKYGKPSNIFAAFPQFNRIIESNLTQVSTITFGDIPHDKKEKSLDNVIFVEDRIINSIQSNNLMQIKNFERFCEELGINLIWGTWCSTSHNKSLEENIFKHYVSIVNPSKIADLAVDLEYELNEETITRADKNHHGEIFHEYWANVFYNKYKENAK